MDMVAEAHDKVVFQSLEGSLFPVDHINIAVICDKFPYDLNKEGPIIQTAMSNRTLKILIHFLYPSQAPPDLSGLSFDSLDEVFSVVSCWGMPLAKEFCRYHLVKYAGQYPMRILYLVEDSSTLLESLSPYLANISAELLLAFGVSPQLCIRWASATFREKSVFAMIQAEQVLDHHDDCGLWRRSIKPFMKQKLHTLGEPRVLLLRRHEEEDIVLIGVDDVFKAALETINNHWNSGDSHHFAHEETDEDMNDDIEDMEDLMMEGNSEDSEGDYGEPSFIQCCKMHLELWKKVVTQEITKVKF
ncbi:hypothetical protein BT96DRAFT_1002160 [Gymnopus androsaceus JB14]|uniref:BTB domain-containing protein n=1 Tax=Gymnopus androsaceus JB14 TaxID=1447944 RepID=A0A6A4H051_9AGAR|nr:hypothetical protein BT96DRAFT_1002160 [Gymnopus androsaceus JB14]